MVEEARSRTMPWTEDRLKTPFFMTHIVPTQGSAIYAKPTRINKERA